MADADKNKKLEELKKQKEELEKMIFELSKEQNIKTNIPYTKVYTTVFPPSEIIFDATKEDPNLLLQIKVFVNKKCNQISTDFSHTRILVDEILAYKDNVIFKEIFTRKLLDQGRVQVASHFESYKPLSYLLFKLNDSEIINMFVRLLITKLGSESELKGMYSIYFGFLNMKEDVDGCWLWLASVLNTNPNQYTGYIVETFLIVCGDLLNEKIPKFFIGILKYLKIHFLKEVKNAPVETRISTIIAKYVEL